MNKSERIREIFTQLGSVRAVAEAVGVSYQFAYNVLSRSGQVAGPNAAREKSPRMPVAAKQLLNADELTEKGFVHFTQWIHHDQTGFAAEVKLPRERGVYAFAVNSRVQYVGLASSGLANRLKSYVKPGPRQPTSQRLNELIRDHVAQKSNVEVYVAFPPDFRWNGWPIDGCFGLEAALIATYDLPWNIRGAKRKGLVKHRIQNKPRA